MTQAEQEKLVALLSDYDQMKAENERLRAELQRYRDPAADEHRNGEPVETRVEWAVESHCNDGSIRHQEVDDEEHAGLVADSITYHLSTLNDPTRQAKGVRSAAIVRREVAVYADGTQVLPPWRHVRDGRIPDDCLSKEG